MSTFGDYDPEDAYDADDDRGEHIHNLIERLALLDDHLPDPVLTVPIHDLDPDVLDEIEQHVQRLQLLGTSGIDPIRLQLILDDISIVRLQ